MPDDYRLCGNELREPAPDGHCHRRAHSSGQCLGCFIATVELEKFLIRARQHAPMGAWAEGYLNAILEDPKRFL